MLYNADSATKVADNLLDIEAVLLSPDSPFQWASGWKSPIYCDNRKTLAFPEVRRHIKSLMAKIISEKFLDIEMVIGVATGGIGIGALVAEELNLPFGYVRSSAKGHGTKSRVEGASVEGRNIVVIEDLISTGGSSLSAVEALRQAGAKVSGMLAIFTYGFDVSEEKMTQAQVELITLSDYASLISAGQRRGLVNEGQLRTLESWRTSPSTWSPAVSAT